MSIEQHPADAIESAGDVISDHLTPAGELARHEQAAERDFAHNAKVGILFEAMWAIGLSFTIISVFIPAYLGHLAAPRSLIGFTSAIGVLTTPLQLLSDRLAGGRHRKRKMWLIYCGCGLAYLMMGIVGLMLPVEIPRGILMGLFIATASIFFILVNIASPTYQAIITDNCPLLRRGRLYGYRAVTLGTIGLAGLVPARWILSQVSTMNAFHIALLIAGTCFMVSSMCPLLFRDHIDPTRRRLGGAAESPSTIRVVMREAIDLVRGLWNTPNYRVFICFVMVLAGSAALGPFMITLTRDLPDMAADAGVSQQQLFQLVFLSASILNGLFVGSVADRWGYKVTLAIQALIATMAFVIAQTADDIALLVVAYGLLSCMSIGMPAVVCNLSVELMPRISPAHLIAAANVIFLPLTVLLPWLSGMIIDVARAEGGAAWGYHVVFTIGATLTTVGCLGIALLVQEPRSGRVYVIKVLERV